MFHVFSFSREANIKQGQNLHITTWGTGKIDLFVLLHLALEPLSFWCMKTNRGKSQVRNQTPHQGHEGFPSHTWVPGGLEAFPPHSPRAKALDPRAGPNWNVTCPSQSLVTLCWGPLKCSWSHLFGKNQQDVLIKKRFSPTREPD